MSVDQYLFSLNRVHSAAKYDRLLQYRQDNEAASAKCVRILENESVKFDSIRKSSQLYSTSSDNS